MLKLVYFFAITLLCSSSDIEGSQQKANQFFNVDLPTFRILTSQLRTVVLWLYNDELQQNFNETLSQVVKDVSSMKRNDSQIVFAQHPSGDFEGFKDPGLYVVHNTQYIIYDVSKHSYKSVRNNQKVLIIHIKELIQPELSQIKASHINSYFENSPDVKLLLLVSSNYAHFTQISEILYIAQRDGKLESVGVQHLRWYNASNYEDYTEPQLLLKIRNKPPIQYQGNFTDIKEMIKFMDQESLPVVYTLTQEVYQRTFQGSIKISIHLLYDETEENDILQQQYQKAAFQNKMSEVDDRCLFTTSSYSQNPDFWSDFGFNEAVVKPQLVLTEVREGHYFLLKTIYQGEINISTITQFIQDYRQGATQFYHKSEDSDNFVSSGIIQHLSERDFSSKTQDKCLVIAYQSFKPEMLKTYEDVLLRIMAEFSRYNIYRIDIVKNEVLAINIKRVPALMLVQNGQIQSIFKESLNEISLQLWIDENLLSSKTNPDL